jgi:hypothetical protein
MSREIIAQLKKLRTGEVNPKQEWLEKNRAILLSQIKNTVAADRKPAMLENVWTALSIFIPQNVVYNVVRPVAVLLVVALVATSGWINTVDAAYNSLPGDWLYPAKRAMEKTQVAVSSVVGGKPAETKMRTELAKRRATEAKQLAKGTDPKKVEKVQQAVNDLKTEIQLVNSNLEEIKATPAGNTGAADTAKEVKQETEQIKNVLQEVKIDMMATAGTSTASQVMEAKEMVKDTSMKATEVMVTKHLEGDTSVTSEQVKKELTTALQTATVDASVNQQNMETAKEVVNVAKTEIKELIATQAVAAQSTSTKELSDKISTVAAETQQAVTKNNEVKAETDKKIDTATQLLSTGDLSKALDIVKEVNATTKEAEKITDNTLAKVQTVIPVVGVVKEVAPIVGVIDPANVIKVQVTTTASTATPAVTVTVSTTPVKK